MADKTSFARKLRAASTDPERLLWSRLRGHRLAGLKFRRQQPFGPYVVDFVCMEKRLVVEADGGQHAEAEGIDARRDAWLREQGFLVLRFWNNEVMENLEGVLETILARCETASPSPPAPLPPEERGD
ncbi:MAG: endonuclease domain-containing protein [Rhodocyclaceae bacterium]